VVSWESAIQVGGELAAREPAGAVGRGGLQQDSSSSKVCSVRGRLQVTAVGLRSKRGN
jgi:hypothetical protein